MVANNTVMFIGIALLVSLAIAGLQIYFGYRVFDKRTKTSATVIEYGKLKVTTGSAGIAVMTLARLTSRKGN